MQAHVLVSGAAALEQLEEAQSGVGIVRGLVSLVVALVAARHDPRHKHLREDAVQAFHGDVLAGWREQKLLQLGRQAALARVQLGLRRQEPLQLQRREVQARRRLLSGVQLHRHSFDRTIKSVHCDALLSFLVGRPVFLVVRLPDSWASASRGREWVLRKKRSQRV